jgi:hypothetical protein
MIIWQFSGKINFSTTISKIIINLITKQSVPQLSWLGQCFYAYGLSMSDYVAALSFDLLNYYNIAIAHDRRTAKTIFVKHLLIRNCPLDKMFQDIMYHILWNIKGQSSYIITHWKAICIEALPKPRQLGYFIFNITWFNMHVQLVVYLICCRIWSIVLSFIRLSAN